MVIANKLLTIKNYDLPSCMLLINNNRETKLIQQGLGI